MKFGSQILTSNYGQNERQGIWQKYLGKVSVEEIEETVRLDDEFISCEHSSLITDKYKENMDAPMPINLLI